MRSLRHWKPRYFAARLAQIAYQKTRPDRPWLARRANRLLAELLRPEDLGMELGSGRSTIWLASRMRRLTSVENNKSWYERVRASLAAAGLDNVQYVFAPTPDDEDPEESEYTSVLDAVEDRSLDFILVDGAHRGVCARKAARKIRVGGILVIDNANWFLPSSSDSPNSRSLSDGPADDDWVAFLESVQDWRRIWTSDGVADTVLYLRCTDSRG